MSKRRSTELASIDPLLGFYRGIIVDDNDPQQRNRYRVHVYGVHDFYRAAGSDENEYGVTAATEIPAPLRFDDPEIAAMQDGGTLVALETAPDFPASSAASSEASSAASSEASSLGSSEGSSAASSEPAEPVVDPNDESAEGSPRYVFRAYPWAETIADTGRGYGFYPVFAVGELVTVAFENGDTRFPYIVGGWTARPNGLSDLPPEIAGDYAAGKNRPTIIAGRGGGHLAFFERYEEARTELNSGRAFLKLWQVDGVIELATETLINMASENFVLSAQHGVEVASAQVTFSGMYDNFGSNGERFGGLAQPYAREPLTKFWVHGFHATYLNAQYAVFIGQNSYNSRFDVSTDQTRCPRGSYEQARLVTIGSAEIIIGMTDGGGINDAEDWSNNVRAKATQGGYGTALLRSFGSTAYGRTRRCRISSQYHTSLLAGGAVDLNNANSMWSTDEDYIEAVQGGGDTETTEGEVDTWDNGDLAPGNIGWGSVTVGAARTVISGTSLLHMTSLTGSLFIDAGRWLRAQGVDGIELRVGTTVSPTAQWIEITPTGIDLHGDVTINGAPL